MTGAGGLSTAVMATVVAVCVALFVAGLVLLATGESAAAGTVAVLGAPIVAIVVVQRWRIARSGPLKRR